MKYYYLEGIEKKGPYTVEEIKSRGLSGETLIFREDKNNWHPLSVFEELIKTEKTDLNPSENFSEENSPKNDEIKIPNYLIYIAMLVVSTGIAILLTYFQQKNDYNKISQEINDIFKGKKSVSDYITDDDIEEKGDLFKVVYHSENKSDLINWHDAYVEANGIILSSKPYKNESDHDSYFYKNELKQWNLFKNLNQYFVKSDYPDGFTVLNLWRSDDSFTVVSYYGGDMAYKVPAKTHYSGTNYGYFTTPGYDISSNRPSIKTCYEEAAEFIANGEKDSSYVPDTYLKILGFNLGRYESDFYEIKQTGDEYVKWRDTIHVIRPNGDRTYVINKNKITASTSKDDGYVQNSQWIVWYKSFHNTYSLQTKKWAFFIYSSIYSVVLFLLFLIVYFVFKNKKRFILE
jgi:GYF domain 2